MLFASVRKDNMTTTTIIVDETQNGQIIFSPELNNFLQISIVSASVLQGLVTQQQTILTNAQKQITTLNATLALQNAQAPIIT
jgi:hypothetical protein